MKKEIKKRPKRIRLICLRGHDTTITGRYKGGACIACRREAYIPHPGARPKVQICPKSHDKDITGRDTQGNCAECKRENKRKWNNEHLEHVKSYEKQYVKEHKIEIKLRHHQYNEEHRNEINAWAVQYRQDHPEMVRASNIKAATNRNLSIVAWTDWEEIHKIDSNCPKHKEVDHYIPLQGKKIVGLHVSWNLQYLTRSENAKKRNKCDLLEASEWYGKILEEAGLK